MAIDVKEWSKRLYDDVPWPEQRQFVEGVIDLIRAVIADEAARQKRDQLDGILGKHAEAAESRIADAQAEVERLKQANTILEADGRQLSASAKEARAEVERLSRPVENETVIHHLPESRRYVPIANFVAERNAREAAEARERKLREFVRHRYIYWFDKVTTGKYSKPITEAELDRLLAAFDADGKVQA